MTPVRRWAKGAEVRLLRLAVAFFPVTPSGRFVAVALVVRRRTDGPTVGGWT